MLVYVEIRSNPTIVMKAKNRFSKKAKEFMTYPWWTKTYYTGVMNDFEVDDFKKYVAEDIKSKANKYKIGDVMPYIDTLFSYRLVDVPEIEPNLQRVEVTPLKDMPVEEVLRVATIPQILQEFGELNIKF